MSSSQFTIFCIILIALFPLHERMLVDGQGVGAKPTCKQTPCHELKPNHTCSCCSSKVKAQNMCYMSQEECTRRCGKP
ncbi:unnamed protein product [Brassica rapa]|uniref:Uncharacterized protein n=1 Tax=Brassica campestris TaxID=3711 RepID=A0A8D9DTX3_BRACM|nr:unnamed protein product [Brassica rapa]CAG7879627.1 unnamed protein product [Brassica rapa]